MKSLFNKLRPTVFALATLATGAIASEDNSLLTDVDFHGFISQGIVYTTDNRLFGNSDDVSLDFHDIAVGAHWRPLDRLQLSGQLLYRQAGGTSRDHLFVDYAMLDILAYQTLTTQVGFRLGRIKNIWGFYNDTRDIASARPSVLMPESVYLDKWRDVYHTNDAFSLYWSSYLGELLISFDIQSGSPALSDQSESEITYAPLAGTIDDMEMDLARILVEAFGGKLRVAHSWMHADWEYTPNPGSVQIAILPGLTVEVPRYGYAGDMAIDMRAWSLEVNLGNWQFTTEHMYAYYKMDGILFPGTIAKEDFSGYYYSLGYQFTPQLRAFVRSDHFYPYANDKKGREPASLTGLPSHTFYAHDTTVGVQYDINEHWFIAAEVHQVKGAAWLSSAENDLMDTRKKWRMFVGQISYKF